MGDLLTLPGNTQRSWRLIRPGIQLQLNSLGIPERQIQRILDELCDYYMDLAREVHSDFRVPEGLLSDEQIQALKVEYARHMAELCEKFNEPFMGAIAVITKLLIEKHQGQFKPGA